MTRRSRILAWSNAGVMLLAASACLAQYRQVNLVSNIPGLAAHTDAGLINPWGISYGPTSPFWVSSAGAGISPLYLGDGSQPGLKFVNIPKSAASTGTAGVATGQIFNGTTDFAVTKNGKTGAGRFIFAGLDGAITAWNPTVDGANAVIAVDKSAEGASYAGIAMGNSGGKNQIYAANFGQQKIDVFNGSFGAVSLAAGAFTDPNLPKGYSPFNIQAINNKLYVAYALQDSSTGDEVHAAGKGLVAVYDLQGNLLDSVKGGKLNAPWGFAMAPSDFGKFSNALLVGNFGDGRINAYDSDLNFLGQLQDETGHSLSIDGLWGITFGNGAAGGSKNKLYFAAGLDDETNGLFGSLQAVPEPGTVALLGSLLPIGLLVYRRRRK